MHDNCGVSTNCGKGNEFYWEFGFKNYHRALVFKNQAQFVLIFGIKEWGVGFQMAKISYEFNQERHIAVLLHLIKSLWSIDDHEQSLKNPGVFVVSSSTFTGRHVPFFYNWGVLPTPGYHVGQRELLPGPNHRWTRVWTSGRGILSAFRVIPVS